jgi:hypothetical protein
VQITVVIQSASIKRAIDVGKRLVFSQPTKRKTVQHFQWPLHHDNNYQVWVLAVFGGSARQAFSFWTEIASGAHNGLEEF